MHNVPLLKIRTHGDPVQVPKSLSPSSIGTFNQCPLQFRLYKIDKIPQDPTDATLKGNFVHEVCEELYKEPAKERTIARAKAIAGRLWHEKWATEAATLRLTADHLHKLRWQAWWCIENLFTMEDPTKNEPLELERFMNGKVRGVPIVGIADRIDRDANGNIVVVDYKTGKVPRPQWAYEKEFQVMIYMHVASQIFREKVERAVLLYLAHGKNVPYRKSEAKVEKMADHVVETWNNVTEAATTGIFEAKPSKLCDWCSYKSICPAWNEE